MSADVVVVGAGNAALCAAISACEAGARVVVLEAAPPSEAGGNSAFTAGAMRVAYDDGAQVRRLLDVDDREFARCDFGAYREQDFASDVERLTDGRADTELTRTLTGGSLGALSWMRGHGVGFEPAYGTQAFEDGGRWRFWGGLPVRVRGEGRGLVGALLDAALRAGAEIRYDTAATGLEPGRGVHTTGGIVAGDGVVLACGGFEANAGWRRAHLGDGWERAKVRGTRCNTGEGIRMALDAGADRAGEWSGCHSVAWDRDAPDTGTLDVAHEFTRNSYQFGIVVDARGERFIDEGADFRNFTYAAYGRAVLAQHGGVAWQVFDDRATPLLRREYFRDDATVVEADSIDGIARATAAPRLAATIRAFNDAVDDGTPFDPSALDGRAARGLAVPKSNWALRIETPPIRAWAVTCGITFTYGGVRVDGRARVLDEAARPLPGVFAAGEMAGGLWHGNYPGGAGLTAGAVFGRLAGRGAAGS